MNIPVTSISENDEEIDSVIYVGNIQRQSDGCTDKNQTIQLAICNLKTNEDDACVFMTPKDAIELAIELIQLAGIVN